MDEQHQPNRRRHYRIKFDATVSIHPLMETSAGNIFETQPKGIQAKALEVSEGGIRLDLGDTDSPANMFKVNFNVHKHESITAYARLAWKKGHTVSLQYVGLDDSSRGQIRWYVNQKIQKKT